MFFVFFLVLSLACIPDSSPADSSFTEPSKQLSMIVNYSFVDSCSSTLTAGHEVCIDGPEYIKTYTLESDQTVITFGIAFPLVPLRRQDHTFTTTITASTISYIYLTTATTTLTREVNDVEYAMATIFATQQFLRLRTTPATLPSRRRSNVIAAAVSIVGILLAFTISLISSYYFRFSRSPQIPRPFTETTTPEDRILSARLLYTDAPSSNKGDEVRPSEEIQGNVSPLSDQSRHFNQEGSRPHTPQPNSATAQLEQYLQDNWALRDSTNRARLYHCVGNHDKAIFLLWCLLKTEPYHIGHLNELHDIWRVKLGKKEKSTPFEYLRFLWLCLLLFITYWLQAWKVAKIVDWWPFAEEDEFRSLQIYTRKCSCNLKTHWVYDPDSSFGIDAEELEESSRQAPVVEEPRAENRASAIVESSPPNPPPSNVPEQRDDDSEPPYLRALDSTSPNSGWYHIPISSDRAPFLTHSTVEIKSNQTEDDHMVFKRIKDQYDNLHPWFQRWLFHLATIDRAKLRIWKDRFDKQTQVRLENLVISRRFCGERVRSRVMKPSQCDPGDTQFRNYFPKFMQPHEGGKFELYIDGLFIQHSFRAGLCMWFLIASGVIFSIIAPIAFFYWWLSQGDVVGASNIGGFFLALGGFFLALGMAGLGGWAFIPQGS